MSFQDVDSIPYIDEHGRILPHTFYEREEQMDVWKFIPKHANVLELGGRYGMVSCVINHKLAERTQHVVVEPDLAVQKALLWNRDRHHAEFTVWPGILSRKQLYLYPRGFSTYCSDISNHLPVCYCSPSDLQVKTGISRFTHLVADCEGGLLSFWNDFPEFFDTLEGIYFEQDNNGLTKMDYTAFLEYLQSSGFSCLKDGKRQYWVISK